MTDLVTGAQTRTGMFDDWLDQRATMRAWEDFLTFGNIDNSRTAGVRREILESWSRSLASGISATAELAPLDETEERLEEARQKNADLRAAARAPFEKIGPLLSEANALLILADADGTVLEQIGDLRTREAARGIHLIRGGKWDETAIGTNGIGTAIRSGRPTIVHASEHFCQGIKDWTCAAAPVRDPIDQRIIGVVDLSGPPGIFRPHNVAMIAAVAREIESALAERQEMRRTRLLEAFLDNGPARGGRDAVVILDRIGRVMYRRFPVESPRLQAAEKFTLGHQFIALSGSMSDQDIARAIPPHLRPSEISRLYLDGEFSGAALILPARPTPAPAAATAPFRIPARAGAERDELLMIGQAPAFVAAVDLARRTAAAGSPVLIQGETGTGKELFARLIHATAARSGPANGPVPFVTVNCGAISAELFGSELFGHAPGAFTGATRDGKPGKFEQADGGVLCLDEIGEMPLELQPYLLRVLEQRAVYRIGCSRRRQVNVQLVAMTNRDLGQEVEAGRFRRDLFYRIGTMTIDVPPLRDRQGDIPALADHFNRAIAARLGRDPLVVAEGAMQRLTRHLWPGNVRELRNLFERLHLMATGPDITEAYLPSAFHLAAVAAAAPAPLAETAEPESLSDMEARTIRRALISEDGNLTRVASVLGISRPTLYRKLKAYGICRSFG